MKGLSTESFFRRIISGNAFNRYKEAFDRAGYAIMLIDNRTNRFIKANKAAAELFGYSQAGHMAGTNLGAGALVLVHDFCIPPVLRKRN